MPTAVSTDPVGGEEIWEVQIAPGELKRMSLEQLDDTFRLGLISGDTLIRECGVDEWLPLHLVAGLDEAPKSPTAAPPPTSQAVEATSAVKSAAAAQSAAAQSASADTPKFSMAVESVDTLAQEAPTPTASLPPVDLKPPAASTTDMSSLFAVSSIGDATATHQAPNTPPTADLRTADLRTADLRTADLRTAASAASDNGLAASRATLGQQTSLKKSSAPTKDLQLKPRTLSEPSKSGAPSARPAGRSVRRSSPALERISGAPRPSARAPNSGLSTNSSLATKGAPLSSRGTVAKEATLEPANPKQPLSSARPTPQSSPESSSSPLAAPVSDAARLAASPQTLSAQSGNGVSVSPVLSAGAPPLPANAFAHLDSSATARGSDPATGLTSDIHSPLLNGSGPLGNTLQGIPAPATAGFVPSGTLQGIPAPALLSGALGNKLPGFAKQTVVGGFASTLAGTDAPHSTRGGTTLPLGSSLPNSVLTSGFPNINPALSDATPLGIGPSSAAAYEVRIDAVPFGDAPRNAPFHAAAGQLAQQHRPSLNSPVHLGVVPLGILPLDTDMQAMGLPSSAAASPGLASQPQSSPAPLATHISPMPPPAFSPSLGTSTPPLSASPGAFSGNSVPQIAALGANTAPQGVGSFRVAPQGFAPVKMPAPAVQEAVVVGKSRTRQQAMTKKEVVFWILASGVCTTWILLRNGVFGPVALPGLNNQAPMGLDVHQSQRALQRPAKN